MGAVPGFCDTNHRSFIARKHLGQPPMDLGTVPRLLNSSGLAELRTAALRTVIVCENRNALT